MSVYTVKERIEIILEYVRGASSREVAASFAALHPNRPVPSKSTIINLYKKFCEHGCLDNTHIKRSRNQSILTDDKRTDICLSAENNPYSSLRSLSEEVGVSKSSCYRTLKQEKYRSYKIGNVQKLLEGDYFKRMEFCEIWMEKINANPNLKNLILFTDESTFLLNGTVHKQNRRIWCRENPHIIHETHTQWPKKVNVWVGIIGNHIVGPFFIDGTLTKEKYMDLLISEVGPALENIRVNGEIIFQHDGAPPHSARDISDFLNEAFPNGWIGRHGSYKWPARSPDLSILDFFLWGYLAQKVYDQREGPANIEDLKNRIVEACRSITVRQLQNVKDAFYDRLCQCLANFGGHFEHLK